MAFISGEGFWITCQLVKSVFRRIEKYDKGSFDAPAAFAGNGRHFGAIPGGAESKDPFSVCVISDTFLCDWRWPHPAVGASGIRAASMGSGCDLRDLGSGSASFASA